MGHHVYVGIVSNEKRVRATCDCDDWWKTEWVNAGDGETINDCLEAVVEEAQWHAHNPRLTVADCLVADVSQYLHDHDDWPMSRTS